MIELNSQWITEEKQGCPQGCSHPCKTQEVLEHHFSEEGISEPSILEHFQSGAQDFLRSYCRRSALPARAQMVQQ